MSITIFARLLSMQKGVFKYYIRILWGVGGVQVRRENVKTVTQLRGNVDYFNTPCSYFLTVKIRNIPCFGTSSGVAVSHC